MRIQQDIHALGAVLTELRHHPQELQQAALVWIVIDNWASIGYPRPDHPQFSALPSEQQNLCWVAWDQWQEWKGAGYGIQFGFPQLAQLLFKLCHVLPFNAVAHWFALFPTEGEQGSIWEGGSLQARSHEMWELIPCEARAGQLIQRWRAAGQQTVAPWLWHEGREESPSQWVQWRARGGQVAWLEGYRAERAPRELFCSWARTEETWYRDLCQRWWRRAQRRVSNISWLNWAPQLLAVSWFSEEARGHVVRLNEIRRRDFRIHTDEDRLVAFLIGYLSLVDLIHSDAACIGVSPAPCEITLRRLAAAADIPQADCLLPCLAYWYERTGPRGWATQGLARELVRVCPKETGDT